MRVTSREYKVIVDESLFADVEAGLNNILDDLGDLGRSVGVEVAGKFDDKDPNERSILFLDTPTTRSMITGCSSVNESKERAARPNTRSSAARKIGT